MSLRSLLFGTALLSSVKLLRILAQFMAIPILARLLEPDQFGVVAIAMPFAVFAMMIADAGIGMSLVRTPLANRKEWDSCFWISVGLGLLLGLLIAALGPLATYIFNEEILTPMLGVLAFVVVAQSVHLIPVAAIQQAKGFKTLALVEVCATLTGLITATILAYRGYGAWALIGQQVAFFAVRVTIICSLSPYKPRLQMSWKEAKEHLVFGRDVLGSAMIQYVGRSCDSWVVGKALSTAAVGVYSMAFQLARLPINTLSGPMQYVLYADLARLKDDPSAIARTFLIATRVVAILLIPVIGMIAAAHAPVFELLLSSKWAEAGVMFMLLAPAAALQSVTVLAETSLYALGHTKRQLRATTEYTILWIGCLLIAAPFGLIPTALTFTVGTLAYQYRYLSMVLKILTIPARQYAETLVLPVFSTLLAGASYRLIVHHLALSIWPDFAVAILCGVCALAVSILPHRQLLQVEWQQFRQRKAVTPQSTTHNPLTDGQP